MNRSVASRAALLAAALLMVPLGGCKDDRESELGPSPGFLDADGLFGTAVLSMSILRYQNLMAEKVLDIVINNRGTPIIERGCDDTGTRTFLRDPTNASRITVRHSNVTYDCGELTEGVIPEGEMVIEVLETSPGLHYTVSIPLNQLTGDVSSAMRYEFGGEIGVRVTATTPGDTRNPVVDPFGTAPFIDCVRDAAGDIRALGTLRIEERTQGILLVEELDLTYGFDIQSSPAHSFWPSGSYEVAAVSPPGFFQAPVASVPVGVTFNGSGGATFDYAGRTCETNLATGDNPCDGL